MTLYTEEQLRQAYIDGMSFIAVDPAKYEQDADEYMREVHPIELPSDEEIWRWWQTQKFQKEQGEQEYTMLYEIDLPKILKAFIKTFNTKEK